MIRTVMRMRVMRVTTMMMLNEDADDDDDDDLLLGLSFSGQLHRAHRFKDIIIPKLMYGTLISYLLASF